jgi:anti-sigma regulatory factor (Ser/Thr protein kinase)
MGSRSTAGAPRDHVVQFYSREAKPEERALVNKPWGSTRKRLARPPETSRTFPAHVNSPKAARHFVVESLQGWADDELLADAALVVTELATNAVVHAHSEFTVAIAPLEDGVRISVLDTGTGQWVSNPAPLMASHGRGLSLVAALTHSWGQSAADGGNVVWADLTVLANLERRRSLDHVAQAHSDGN